MKFEGHKNPLPKRKLTKADRDAERMLWKAKISGTRITNAEVVRRLARSRGRASYKATWALVRRARRRVNRKYAFVIRTASQLNLTEDLVAQWVRQGLLSPDNCTAVARILRDYSQQPSSLR